MLGRGNLNNKLTRIVTFTVIFSLLTPFLTVIIIPQSSVACARELNKEDAYKGLGVSLLLFYLLKGLSNDAVKVEAKTEVNISYSEEVEWLARAVYGESRGESFKGQVAVAAVILNRVESTEFPDTIYGVIHQKGQFSAVEDGQIKLKPNQRAYRAAKEALAGNDPTYGAVYFYNPKTAKTLWWLETRETTVQIGNHVFAR